MIGARTLRVLVIGLVIAAVVAALWVRDRHLRKSHESRLKAEIAKVETEAGRRADEAIAAARKATSAAKVKKPVTAPPPPPPRLVDLSITPHRRKLVRDAMPAFDPDAEVEVPFTRFVSASHTARLLMTPARLASVLDVSGIGRVAFPRNGVPLKMAELAPGRLAVFFREMFSGHLYLYRVGTKVEHEIRIRGPKDAEPILREAAVHQGRLLAILYDNERGVNEVVALDPDGIVAEVTPRPIATLPTLEDPAGRTYEMIPTLHFLTIADGLWVVGGTLLAELGPQPDAPLKILRLPGCLRAQDVAASGAELTVLCLNRSQGQRQPYATANIVVDASASAFKLVRWSRQDGFRAKDLGVSDSLPYQDGSGSLQRAVAAADIFRVLTNDLATNHSSGVMELGTNNLEGRIAWSQIYFLNGLLDLLLLAVSDEFASDMVQPFLADTKRRLDIEIYLLDRLVASDLGFVTKGFTVGRNPALFAVQTARLLLLFNRYRREIGHGATLHTHDDLRADVFALRNHIEKLAIAGPHSREPRPGRHYLHWPKGSAFYFDGLNVPYNHQNEWAYAVLDSISAAKPETEVATNARAAAIDIIGQFTAAVAPDSVLPDSGTWPYWWGQARQGWTQQAGLSINTPNYPGDKLIAWISFRSIDVMSVLAARDHLPAAATSRLRASIADLVSRGLVYPFVAASFVNREKVPLPNPVAALSYARMTAPSDLQSSVWAHYALARAAVSLQADKGRP